LWLSEGDTPTHFFHVLANVHHRRRSIRSLEHNEETLRMEHGKVAAPFEFYDSLMGVPAQHSMSINLDLLGLPHIFTYLAQPITS
jgi:hypothetical protein